MPQALNASRLLHRSTAGMIACSLGMSILLGGLIFSCAERPTRPDPYSETEIAQLLRNSRVEDGYLWQGDWSSWSSVSGDTSHQFTWSEEASVSPTHSLKISASSMPPSGVFAYWTQAVGIQPGEYTGLTLRLSTSIKLDEVMGQGVSILITAYDDSMNMVGAAGTQGEEVIRGTMYWREYSARLTNLSADARTLNVYLVFLPDSRGTSYFDDINLTVLKRDGF